MRVTTRARLVATWGAFSAQHRVLAFAARVLVVTYCALAVAAMLLVFATLVVLAVGP